MPLKSLRSLTILFLALFLVVSGLSAFGFYLLTEKALSSLADQQIAAISESLAPNGVVVGERDLVARITALRRDRATGAIGIVLSRGDRTLIANVALARPLPLGPSSLGGDDHIAGMARGRALVRDLPGGLRLAVLGETEVFDGYLRLRDRIYIAAFASVVLIVLGGLALFRQMVGARILAMRVTADAIIDGDLSQRVPVSGSGDEFDQQAIGFNRMLDRISELMAEISHVTHDLAHELRSPLTRLRGRLSRLSQRGDAEPLRAEIEEAIAATDQVLALSNAILRIAEVESGRRRAGFARIEADAVLREVVEMLAPVAEDAGLVLKLVRCDPAMLLGDRQLLAQMAVNLIENAVRHARSATRIEVSLAADGALSLSVRDDGPGMRAADRAEAMRRFGRLERSRSGVGYGLGLPLVDAIARMHGGSLALEDAHPGLRAVITLPRGG